LRTEPTWQSAGDEVINARFMPKVEQTNATLGDNSVRFEMFHECTANEKGARTLNHPLKRLAFVLFVLTTIALVAMVIGPASPLTVRRYSEWKDASGNQSADRTIVRLDTHCAGGLSGTVEAFAHDFIVLSAATNLYAGIGLQDDIAHHDVTIADKVDLTDEEYRSFQSQLSGNAKPCIGDGRVETKLCVETLSAVSLDNVLKSCAVAVRQNVQEQTEIKWYIAQNFEQHAPWTIIALVLDVAFLFMSVLYAQTLGRVVRWIING
jgi:hypothetical protein